MAKMARRTFKTWITQDGFEFTIYYQANARTRIGFLVDEDLSNPRFIAALKWVQQNIDALEPYLDLTELLLKYVHGKGLDTVSDGQVRLMRELLAQTKATGQGFTNSYITHFEEWLAGTPFSKQLAPTNKSYMGFVYLLRSETGKYKIGRTTDPDDRIKTFHVKLPFEVEFLCVIPTENMHLLESRLHHKFRDKRIKGEWFNLTIEDVDYIKSLDSDDVA